MQETDFFSFAADLVRSGRSFVAATVIRTEGSTLAKPGFRVIVSNEGKILYGSLGGACPEGAISRIAQDVLKSGNPRIFKIHLEEAEESLRGTINHSSVDEVFVETFCGGNMDLFVEPFKVPERIVVITPGGKDEIADFIGELAGQVGMRQEILDLSRLVGNDRSDIIDPLESFRFEASDYVVVLTKGDEDIKVLKRLSRERVSYLGLLASRKRSAHDFEILRKEKIQEEFINSIHTPIGIDVGAVLPAEIALSIMAEIISIRRLKKNPQNSGTLKP